MFCFFVLSLTLEKAWYLNRSKTTKSLILSRKSCCLCHGRKRRVEIGLRGASERTSRDEHIWACPASPPHTISPPANHSLVRSVSTTLCGTTADVIRWTCIDSCSSPAVACVHINIDTACSRPLFEARRVSLASHVCTSSMALVEWSGRSRMCEAHSRQATALTVPGHHVPALSRVVLCSTDARLATDLHTNLTSL